MLLRKKYSKPEIKKTRIDNQISLIMMSEGGPPGGPIFGYKTDDIKNNEPYKA